MCYTLSMKILSPVGNFESLKMAICGGADEVYLGVNNFNARNNIEGFSLVDLDEVTFLCHIHGIKVNLAVNILFRDDELEDAVNLIVTAFNKGVDCFIIQDLGLACVVHENYPEIELHASTQMGICNLEGARFVEKLGFKRVVLARETPIEEIKNIKKNTSLEIEYFVQGALCVCFSGNCYLSSYLCDASGNRGKCKQLCRLPFELLKNGKVLKQGFLLSAKDFNMISCLKELESAGVDVLKIEGRARRPFYVGVATRVYKSVLLGQIADENMLRLAFNRDYTAGYFDGNGNIISKFNNHIGVCVGKVLKVQKGKKFNVVEFSSNREISQKSAIKLFQNNKEVSVISLFDLKKIGKNQYQTTTTQLANVGDNVNLISDFEIEKSVLEEEKKAKLNIFVHAFSGENLKIQTELLGQKIEFVSDVLQKAKSQELSKKEIEICFDKNPYFIVDAEIETDGVFVQKSVLNAERRAFFEVVLSKIKQSYAKNKEKIHLRKISILDEFKDFQFAQNKSEKREKKNIIYSPEFYDENDILNFACVCEQEKRKMFLDLPNFALDKDVEFLKNIVEKNKIPVVCNNYYAVDFQTEKVAGGGLNVFNHFSAYFLNMPVICAEDGVLKKTAFAFMTLRHCPMKNHLNATCERCPYSSGFEFRMQNGKILKLKRKKLSSCTFYLTN